MKYGALTEGRPRDARRARVYKAERFLHVNTMPGYKTLRGCQGFVDRVVHDPWLRDRYRVIGRRSWEAVDASWRSRVLNPRHAERAEYFENWEHLLPVETHDENDNHAYLDLTYWPMAIYIPEDDAWFRSKAVLLHEIAHWLTPVAEPYHGRWFAACMVNLVGHFLRPSWAQRLDHRYRSCGVTAPLRRDGVGGCEDL